MRIRERGSSAGHNGMQSIIDALGPEEILRMSPGAAPDHPVRDGVRYLLSPFKKTKLLTLDEGLNKPPESLGSVSPRRPTAPLTTFTPPTNPNKPDIPTTP